ncbi:hypothetical protein [Desulfosediminicola sp.]|uniref:hypothetical protein n=1 Tax=Desulfosediminicola sp. TaxID=2886825 RepID=UPI003AF1FDE4
MLSIVSLLLVLASSILVTRIATVALTHTGLSRESARFQARSAFTGVGFTTNESEKVANHSGTTSNPSSSDVAWYIQTSTYRRHQPLIALPYNDYNSTG